MNFAIPVPPPGTFGGGSEPYDKEWEWRGRSGWQNRESWTTKLEYLQDHLYLHAHAQRQFRDSDGGSGMLPVLAEDLGQ